MQFGKKTQMDETFLMENMMGPNCLRHIEDLAEKVTVKPGSRVLDLACGKGLTSIFLATEYDVTVFAADLWIEPTENFERFKKLGLDDRIIPIHAEAHDLPFANEYFDAVFCVDAYHYFGAEEGYLDKHLLPLVAGGGNLAVSIPGLQRDFTKGVPEALKPFWEDDMNFYSVKWWKELWERSPGVEIQHSYSQPCHTRAWEEWLRCDNPYAKQDIAMMQAEGGKYFDSIGMIAAKK